MSIYHPPSKTQSVFNPSNFGGLGTGGQITTDYLDANYIQYPVSQGNATLVGTSVLGDITQQGDFSTTGDITGDSIEGTSFLVGTTNLLTEIGTKQDEIQDGDLTIANTSGLQTALNGKQPTIEDGDLTIAKTDGLQSALNGKQPTIEDGDLTIANTDGLLEALNTKQPTIEDGDLTIATTDGLQTVLTTLNQKYIPHNPDSFGLKAVSSWTERTASAGLWLRVVYAPELNLFIAISENTFSQTMMSSVNGFDWEYVSSSPNFLYDIVWSEELSLFVVVSRTSPYIHTSSDGVVWTGQSVPTTESLQAIDWSPELGLFAVVSFKGDLITSPDGLIWTSRTKPNVNQGYSICWSKELAVFIVGYQNELSISSNGIDWTSIDTFDGIWRSIAWSPKLGLFAAVSNSRSFIITSPDGLNWSENAVSFRYNKIIWSDIGIFIAVGTGGYIMYSNDGINWVENDLSGVLQGVCWSDELGIFVVVGNNSVYTSTLKGRPPTMFNTFDSEFNSIDEDGTWNFNSITLPIIGDVEDAIQGKQATINANDLAITDTAGLSTALAGKQPTIEDGDLTIAKTDGLQTALNGKQSTITTATDLTSNSLTTTDLVVNESLNIDNVITYEKYKQFDTIVIRRFDEATTPPLNMSEIQVWVNNVNIMFQNEDTLTSYFASWSDKFVELDPATPTRGTELMYNNIITGSNEVDSGVSVINAIIINNIPLNFANDIQAIVLYHRQGAGNMPRAE